MKEPEQALSEQQVSLVLRRAAELERNEPGSESLTPAAEVEAIAAEVGLSREAVARALAEVRAGVVVPAESKRGTIDKVLGPAVMVVERVVPGMAAAVQARLERFLGSQLFRVKRRIGGRILWEHARGVLPGLRRTLDLSARYAFPRGAELESLVVDLPGGEPKVLVRIALHLEVVRADRLSSAVTGTLAGAGLAALGFVIHTVPAEVILLLAGGGTAAGSLLRSRRRYRATAAIAETALERFLDEPA